MLEVKLMELLLELLYLHNKFSLGSKKDSETMVSKNSKSDE